MRSFNEKFNKCCADLTFWHELIASLICAHTQMQCGRNMSLSHKDKKILLEMSKTVADVIHKSQQTKDYHARQLNRLRGDYLNER